MFTALPPTNATSSSLNFSRKPVVRKSSDYSDSPTREKIEAQVQHLEAKAHKKSWQKVGDTILKKLRDGYRAVVDFSKNNRKNT